MSTKRATDLAEKLRYKENERLLEKLPIWITESEPWARKMIDQYGPNGAQKDVDGYRLLYVLNHLCPSLYHFHRQPDPKRFMGDMDGYNAAAQKHFLENTQAGLLDSDGTLIQEGVCYDAESFNAFLAVARSYCDKYLEQLWHELADVPFDDHPESDMTLAEPWHGFPAGTERGDIWHWFDDRYSGEWYRSSTEGVTEMTLNEVIKRINAAILDVPQEERIRKLAGKNSFLQGLLRQEMVESDEAKAALAEYHMRAEITWDFGVPVPTLDVYVQLTEDSPYAIIGHRYSHGSWKFLSFKRKKCTINGRATMSADLAVLSEFGPKGDITVAEYYAERFRNIQKACEGTIQMVKGIDLLISTFGHEKAAELVQSIKDLDSNTGLNFFNSQYKGFWNRSIFNDGVRDKILALDTFDKDNLSDLSNLAVDILLDATDYIGNQPEQFSARRGDISTMRTNASFHAKLQAAVDEWATDRANDGADLQMSHAQAAKFVWDLYMLYIVEG